MIQLSEIADIQTGPFGSQLHKEDYASVGRPIVTVEHLGERAFTEQNLPLVSEKDAERLKKYQMKPGDIIFSRVGSIDRCSYAEKQNEGWLFSGRCLRIRPNKTYDSEFLYYHLSSSAIKKFVRNIAVGATMPSINTTLMGEIPVPEVPLNVQHAIARVMTSLDCKIQTNTKLNGYLLEQLKAYAKNLYGEYEQDEDAPLPAGWTRVSIDEIAEMVCRGITPKYNADSDEFVLGQTCIRDNLVLTENGRAHSPKKVTEKWLHKYDLLINSTGVGSLGRTAQIWFEPSKLVVDSHVTIVRAAKPSHALYLGFWAFKHEKFIESLHTGSTGQTELPREHVKAISVVLPDSETLAAFNTIASPSVGLIAANQEENKRLAALRDALLPKLMSGEIDVSEVDLTQLNSHLA